MSDHAIIGLVDDEPGMLRALSRLLRIKGFAVRTFESPEVFLAGLADAHLDCVVLDVAMPRLNGLELQVRLKDLGARLPIIFLTGQGDIPMSVRAIKAGAVNFLTKPVEQEELLAAVRVALTEGERDRVKNELLAGLRGRMERLTPRELEVLRHVTTGKLNKQIAADLGVSEMTIKIHRMRITEKMGLVSVAELVRAAQQLGIAPAD
jgi:two-component system, LuxR family, response regulator FixJ